MKAFMRHKRLLMLFKQVLHELPSHFMLKKSLSFLIFILLGVSLAVLHSVSVIDELKLKIYIPEPLIEVSSVSSPGSVKALQPFNISVTDWQPVNQLINPFQVWRQTAQFQQINLVKYGH